MKHYNILILFLNILFTFQSFAQELKVERVNDELFLKGKNCELVKKQIMSLEQWNKVSSDKDCNISKGDYKEHILNNKKSCKVNISTCVPEHVKKYHSRSPEVYGPNCWNLSLVMANILPNLRLSTPEEMEFFMKPPLCRAIKENEKKLPGDIGAIRNEEGEEIHGFIYVSEELVYSKNGTNKASPYALQSINDMNEIYFKEYPEKCKKYEISSNCTPVQKFFRCISMKEYLENESTNSTENENENEFVLPSLENLECHIGNSSFNKSVFGNQEALSLISKSMKALDFYINEELKTDIKQQSEKEIFILTSTKLRIDSIMTHLQTVSMLEFSDMNYSLYTLESLLKKSNANLNNYLLSMPITEQ
jgi:hypothetical protein